MSSLPWICAVTLALLCCLTAHPVAEKSNSVSILIQEFSDSIENDTCWKEMGNPTYYAPVDVNRACVYSALDCYVKELDVLVEECQSVQEDVKDAAEDLMMTLRNLTTSDSSCSNYICEVSPQKPFKEFLNNMTTLVQQIMSLQNARL